MPQSITIAAFVLGAVLLLIALLGGNFKIFGAEVSGHAGQGPRMLAGGLGALFIAIGLFGSFASSKPASAGHVDPGGQTTGGSEVARQPPDNPPPPTRPEPPNIAGRWRDELGTVYQITQNGSTFTFEGYNSGNGIGSRGSGEITGRSVTNTFQISTPQGPVHGRGSGSVSDDGRTMYGTFSDSYYGQYSHTLTRTQ